MRLYRVSNEVNFHSQKFVESTARTFFRQTHPRGQGTSLRRAMRKREGEKERERERERKVEVNASVESIFGGAKSNEKEEDTVRDAVTPKSHSGQA